jgi:hypothetical protein
MERRSCQGAEHLRIDLLANQLIRPRIRRLDPFYLCLAKIPHSGGRSIAADECLQMGMDEWHQLLEG